MSSTSRAARTRKRGICASRIKLEKAMAEAGCKTQAALAERIATIENLDTVPKDFVSKVFREQSVDPSSIERIAAALGVEAYKLYQTHNDKLHSSLSEPENGQATNKINEWPAKPDKSGRLDKRMLLTLLPLLALLFIWLWNVGGPRPQTLTSSFSAVKPALGKYSILLISQSAGKPEYQLDSLSALLTQRFTLSPAITDVNHKNSLNDFALLAERYEADAVLTVDNRIVGNFMVIDTYLYADNTIERIWSTNPRREEFSKNPEQFWQPLHDKLIVLFGLQQNTEGIDTFLPELVARDYYIEGRNLLDRSQAELSFKSAQSRFFNALSIAPDYALAHAGLCESLVIESWMGNEKILLEQAQRACTQAATLDGENVYIKAAQAHLYRRSGRVKEALQLLETEYQKEQNNVDLLINLAYLHHAANKLDLGLEQALSQARGYAQQAIELAPSFWKSYQVLGLIELSSGDIQASINAFTQAVNIDANELMLTNLGTLNFCRDNLDQALRNYQQASQFSPESHLSSEMMGMIKYFQGDFAQSLALRQQAAEALGDAAIHQIWGAIADTYSQLEQSELALKNYTHALDIIAKDSLRGNLSPSDQAHELYYLLRIQYLKGQVHDSSAHFNTKVKQLEAKLSVLDTAAIIRLALIELMQKNQQKAHNLLNTAAAICPVYKKLPEFAHNNSHTL